MWKLRLGPLGIGGEKISFLSLLPSPQPLQALGAALGAEGQALGRCRQLDWCLPHRLVGFWKTYMECIIPRVVWREGQGGMPPGRGVGGGWWQQVSVSEGEFSLRLRGAWAGKQGWPHPSVSEGPAGLLHTRASCLAAGALGWWGRLQFNPLCR